MSSSDFSEFISDFSSGMEVRKSAAETVGCLPEQYIASMIYRDGNDSLQSAILKTGKGIPAYQTSELLSDARDCKRSP